jgi:hypothetical protein
LRHIDYSHKIIDYHHNITCKIYPRGVTVSGKIFIEEKPDVLDAAESNHRGTRLKIEKGSKNLVALFALVSVGFSAAALLLQILVLSNVINIAKKPAPSLVQLTNGQAIRVKAIGSNDRSLDVVQNFTTESLIMLMSWTNELPAIKDQPKTLDQGFLVRTKGGDKLITLSAFQASFVFGDNLRDEVVKILGEMTPSNVFNGSVKTTLKFQHVTIPTPLEEGRWRIRVIGTLLQYQPGRGDTVKVPFNKEIIVQAIDTPALPAGGKFSNELEAVVYNIRQAGLEIVAMKDIEITEGQQPVVSPSSSPN